MRFPSKGQNLSLPEVLAICTKLGLHKLHNQIRTNPPEIAFSSDGCSAWPDTWLDGSDLYEGCFIHDLHYWAGVPGDELGRLEADIWLMRWVAQRVNVQLAEKMFQGVRIGGAEWLPSPWRWGYGRR